MAQTHGPGTMRSVLIAAAVLTHMSACVDVGGFAGVWAGPVSAEDALLQGFEPGVAVNPLAVEEVSLTTVRATLTTDDGMFSSTHLEPIDGVTADALSSLTFAGNPLRSYMMFADAPAEDSSDSAWLVLSLFADDRVELRIMRRNNLFGVFQLRRQE